MNTDLFFFSILQFGLSLMIGMMLIYATFKIINKRIAVKYKLEFTNVAFAILCGAILFSVSYLIEGVKEPLMNTIRIIQNDPSREGSLFFESIKYAGIFLVISVVVIGIINVLSIHLFKVMTRGINEFEEIKKENIAVSIITSVIIVSISLMVKDSVMLMLESFIPYPEIPKIL